jgi:hypothetical protein
MRFTIQEDRDPAGGVGAEIRSFRPSPTPDLLNTERGRPDPERGRAEMERGVSDPIAACPA